jgi:iron complex outermembrane recepter protein
MKLPTPTFPIAALAAAVLFNPASGASGSARAQVAPASFPAAAGAGATTAPVTLEPLRVTADLWESPLHRIPASVSVYDEQTLRTGAVSHFGDLADRIPNLTWTGGTSRPRYLQIRGIGENSQYEGETPDSTVRFLVDDLDFTGLGTLAGTFDVRQIEVLRGPQAGAFGANAAGGLVRLVTNAPTPFWTGLVEGSIGGDSLRAGGIAVGGPLMARNPEQLMARLALHRHVSDGFRRNVTLNRDTNARDERSARLRLTLNPGREWRWDASFLFSEVDNGFDEFALDNNGYHTFSDQPGRDRQKSLAGSLRGAYTGFSGVRLTSVTSATRVDSVYSYDDDWTAASYRGFSDLGRERDVFAQELRLDSVLTRGATPWFDRWTLGGYAAATREDSDYTNEDPGNVRGLRTNHDARQYALFGQAGHDLGARSRVVLGLRVERVEVDGDGTRTRFRKSRDAFDPVVTFAPRFNDTLIGGKLAFEFDLNERQLAFASVTRGYKAGGINIDARINPAVDPLEYRTEYLWNYEAGLRGNWLEQRLAGEVTAFYLQRHDAQVRDSAGFGGSYRFFTDNANRARVYGLESSASFAATQRWSVYGSLALMNSRLDRFVLANGNTGGGRRLANTPPHGYTLGSRYRDDHGWFGQVELVGRARQFDSNNHDEARRAFNVVNVSLGYDWHGWTFTLWARNVFNERYQKRVFFFGNEEPDFVPKRYESRADPRQVGVTAAYRF